MPEIESSYESSPQDQDVSSDLARAEAKELYHNELGPLLQELTCEERERFDDQLVAYFASNEAKGSEQTAETVLQELTLDELIQVSQTVRGFLARKSFRELGIIPPHPDY